jgi:hypothetical protein
MNAFTLFAVLFVCAAALTNGAPYATNVGINDRVQPFGHGAYQMLAGLMTSGAGTQAFMTEFAQVRFTHTHWHTEALKMAVIWEYFDLCIFLIQRTIFQGPLMRNRMLSAVLIEALSLNQVHFIRHFWFEDFQISHLPLFYLSLSQQNMEEVKRLLSSSPKRLAEIVPDRHAVESLKADTALRVIDLACYCTTLNAADFDLTRLLGCFVKSYMLVDADMARVIRRLCEAGASVTPAVMAELAHRRPSFVLSRKLLEEYHEVQNLVKEPETD